MKSTQIRSFIWFQKDLEEAVKFYQSIFKDFKLHSINKMNENLIIAEFAIHGQEFVAMDSPGGAEFNNSFSISVQVDGQAEVDRLWDAITKEGEEIACGWAKDKWGLHWQIVPFQMHDWMGHSDPEVAQYAFQAMMGMKKIIIDQLHK